MYTWTRDAALRNKGAVWDYLITWPAERYLVGGKIFAMKRPYKDGRPILTLKCNPDEALLLRKQYVDIIPGYYVSKKHWNSIFLGGAVPQEEIERMIHDAYELVLQSLSKAKRTEALEG